MKKRDPRVKLIFIVILTSLAVLAKDAVYLSIILFFAVLINLCLKVDLLQGIKRIRHFLSVIIFITIVQSLFVKGGTTLINIGTVNILTTKGLFYALEFLLRMSIIVFSGLISLSTDGREMADGLLKFHLPYEFVFMSAVTLRFFPIFREEFSSRVNAISVRGINIKKLNLFKKIKLYSYLISPTIAGCLIRSEDLAKSVESRGFRAEKKRTMFRELKMDKVDWIMVLIGLVLCAAFLFFNYYYGPIINI